jgi:hypothetical protein
MASDHDASAASSFFLVFPPESALDLWNVHIAVEVTEAPCTYYMQAAPLPSQVRSITELWPPLQHW